MYVTENQRQDGPRIQQACRRAMYEFPGFAAGTVIAVLERDLALLREHGHNSTVVATVRDDLARCVSMARDWQRLAICVTDYDAAHSLLEIEK